MSSNNFLTSITTTTKTISHSPKPLSLSSKTATSTRRKTLLTLSTTSLTLLASPKPATSFDFRITTPDQTVEQANAGIRIHAKSLVVDVKELIDFGEWKEAQKVLRKNAGLLKQDLYTIIQNKPGIERGDLRKMFFVLFSNVSKLDYAARDRDEKLVLEIYDCFFSSL